MKRRDLLRHLSQHGCRLVREGGNIRFGRIRRQTAVLRCRATVKYLNSRRHGFASNSEFLSPPDYPAREVATPLPPKTEHTKRFLPFLPRHLLLKRVRHPQERRVGKVPAGEHQSHGQAVRFATRHTQ